LHAASRSSSSSPPPPAPDYGDQRRTRQLSAGVALLIADGLEISFVLRYALL
jgi:hypothetical protein